MIFCSLPSPHYVCSTLVSTSLWGSRQWQPSKAEQLPVLQTTEVIWPARNCFRKHYTVWPLHCRAILTISSAVPNLDSKFRQLSLSSSFGSSTFSNARWGRNHTSKICQNQKYCDNARKSLVALIINPILYRHRFTIETVNLPPFWSRRDRPYPSPAKNSPNFG